MIPEDLVNQIIKKNCVVLVGAGLSMNSGLPDWKSLLIKMLDWYEKYEKKLTKSERDEFNIYIKEGNLLLVAEELKERFGNKNYITFMNEIFGNRSMKYTYGHELLTKINFLCALTTNYDRLLESVYSTVNKGMIQRVFTHEDYPELSDTLHSEDFYILKLH